MSIIDQYKDDVERAYLTAHSYQTPYFAPGELCKIENYAIAAADNFTGWVIHHRAELHSDGSVNQSRDELIVANKYYYRPSAELIFLSTNEHSQLHMLATRSTIVEVSAETRTKQSQAKLIANNTEERFRVVSELVESGEVLSFSDYQFYRRYCQRNGIEFTGAKVDKTHTVERVDVPLAPSGKVNPSRSTLTELRYQDDMAQLQQGVTLPMKEFSFIRRYCNRRQIERPPITLVDGGFKLKNISCA